MGDDDAARVPIGDVVSDAGSPLGEPAVLADLVDYQDGAVVSRVLAKRGGGSLTLFAFDGGEGLSEHATPHTAIVTVLAGTVEITIAGTLHRCTAGEAILLPGGVPHALNAPERCKLALTLFHQRA